MKNAWPMFRVSPAVCRSFCRVAWSIPVGAAPHGGGAAWCGVCTFSVTCMAPCCVARRDGAAWRSIPVGAAPPGDGAAWCGDCPFPAMCMAPCCVANLDGVAGRGGCVVACCCCLVSSVHGAAPGCGVCSEGAA